MRKHTKLTKGLLAAGVLCTGAAIAVGHTAEQRIETIPEAYRQPARQYMTLEAEIASIGVMQKYGLNSRVENILTQDGCLGLAGRISPEECVSIESAFTGARDEAQRILTAEAAEKAAAIENLQTGYDTFHILYDEMYPTSPLIGLCAGAAFFLSGAYISWCREDHKTQYKIGKTPSSHAIDRSDALDG